MHGKDLSIHKKVLDFIISTLHFLYLGGGGIVGWIPLVTTGTALLLIWKRGKLDLYFEMKRKQVVEKIALTSPEI